MMRWKSSAIPCDNRQGQDNKYSIIIMSNPQDTKLQSRTQSKSKERHRTREENILIEEIMALEAKNLGINERIDDLRGELKRLNDKVIVNSVSNLASQGEKLEHELMSVAKAADMKKRELKKVKKYLSLEQKLQSIESLEEEIMARKVVLERSKREVKELELKNRNLELKSSHLRRETKSLSNINQIRSALSINKYLKTKISKLTEREKEKERVVKKRVQTQINTTEDRKSRLSTLPEITDSRKSLSIKMKKEKQKALEKEKAIVTKWIGDHRMLINQNLDTQLTLITKQHDKLLSKIQLNEAEIGDLRKMIERLKYSLPQNQPNEKKKTLEVMHKQPRTKQWGTGLSQRTRPIRKDWVGRFDSVRFSDSRVVREESRLYSILHNDEGYYRFSYYSLKSGEIYESSLPFNTVIAPSGQERVFEVVWPDYIKTIEVVIDTKVTRIAGMNVRSMAGVEGEFIDNVYDSKQIKKKSSKPHIERYSFEIGNTQVPMCLFGSYKLYYEGNSLSEVFLQGLGVDIIEEPLPLTRSTG